MTVPADAAALARPAPIKERNAKTVTADVLPTAQIDDGVVWALKVSGNTVYAGGTFNNARPAGAEPGQRLVPRANILAFSLTTGELTSFAPNLNGTVKALALSPDGRRLYVGGTFSKANGQWRSRIAAFDTRTGQLVPGFAPVVAGAYVNAIVATDTTVYVGGGFGQVDGIGRQNLFAVDTSGRLLGWAPTANGQVDTMVIAANRLIVGGRFSKVNKTEQRGMAALSLTNGSKLAWAAANTIRNGWTTAPYAGKSGIYSLSTDGKLVYGTGWMFANKTIGNLEGSFAADPATGAIKWINDCHGDTYSSYSDGTNVYFAGHPHDCESVGGFPQKDTSPPNTRNSLVLTTSREGTLWRSPRVSNLYADWNGKPAPAIINWFPDWVMGTASGQGQATWTVDGSGDYVVFGGEFPYVNNKRQQGLARFARPGVSPAKEGPRLSSTTMIKWEPAAVSASSGKVRITVPGNWDRDNARLTYAIRRSDLPDPIYKTTADSYFWRRPTITYTDTSAQPGRTYTYYATATDPDGNQSKSATVSVKATTGYSVPYRERVIADGALLHWSFDKGTGADTLKTTPGTRSAGVSAVTSPLGGAARLSGTTSGRIATSVEQISPDVFSAEIWFKTKSKKGGKIFGFGSSSSGYSKLRDRHLYLSNKGKLSFGITQNNKHLVITSKKTYRDNKWHHAVVTQGSSGSRLYVDGVRVAAKSTAIKPEDYYGYWRIGGDSTVGWTGRGTSHNFAGDLDEFSLYGKVLSASAVRAHYREGSGVGAPSAKFTVTGASHTVKVQAKKTGLKYAWDFGDGGTATGAKPKHVYAEPGTYRVTLTVTDASGIRARTSKTVVVSN